MRRAQQQGEARISSTGTLAGGTGQAISGRAIGSRARSARHRSISMLARVVLLSRTGDGSSAYDELASPRRTPRVRSRGRSRGERCRSRRDGDHLENGAVDERRRVTRGLPTPAYSGAHVVSPVVPRSGERPRRGRTREAASPTAPARTEDSPAACKVAGRRLHARCTYPVDAAGGRPRCDRRAGASDGGPQRRGGMTETENAREERGPAISRGRP